MPFQPDYRHMLAVMRNVRPSRLPLYEHGISPLIMEQVLGAAFAELAAGDDRDLYEFYRWYCRFFAEMTYDTVSCEVGLVPLLPGHGAIMGGRPGPIQSRADFERYPWAELPDLYWRAADRHFAALRRNLPPGMKAIGGVGYGVLEASEDLVGFEQLAYLQADDPELFADLYAKIGDLLVAVWGRVLAQYGDTFAICRMGDDLGFKTSTLLAPRTIRQYILPQYRRIIGQIKAAGKPFLWHSCGCIFPIMDDVIALGIDAKHSNEDVIAPYERWIELYGERIGLLGGIDVDLLCRKAPAEVFDAVLARGGRYRALARGYALGSGNSIPDYVPVEGYLAMVRAGQALRACP
jgi:uroporphyrinogen decarboxylase